MNYNFEKPQKLKFKLALLIGLAFIWTTFLAIFIYTSWYENDLWMTKEFGEAGIFNRIIRGLSNYIVQEGYFTLTTLTIPVAMLLVESLLIYLKKYYEKKPFFQFIYRNRHKLEFGAVGIWTIAIIFLCWGKFWSDEGFGVGIDKRTFTTLTESIVISVIIILFNNLICYSLTWYSVYKVATKPDFMAKAYWKKVIFFALFTCFMYFIIITFKMGFQRPLYNQVVWKDQLEYLKTINPDAWEHYMTQNDFNYGWQYGPSYSEVFPELGRPDYINNSWQSVPGEWPWWKIAQVGSFWNGKNGIPGTFFPDNAFPSGHLETGMSVLFVLWIFTMDLDHSPKQRLMKFLGRGIGIGYIVYMFLGLGFTFGHWMSDMAFTIILAPFIFWLAQATNYLICNVWLVKLDQKIEKKKNPNLEPLL